MGETVSSINLVSWLVSLGKEEKIQKIGYPV
jgi:hypothetical protein